MLNDSENTKIDCFALWTLFRHTYECMQASSRLVKKSKLRTNVTLSREDRSHTVDEEQKASARMEWYARVANIFS